MRLSLTKEEIPVEEFCQVEIVASGFIKFINQRLSHETRI